jgi:hypothetical protein
MMVGRMADEYDIYLRGFAAGSDAPRALHRVFGIELARARELVISLPRVVKRRLSAEQVVRYELALRHVRADYEVRKSPLRPSLTAMIGGGASDGGARGATGAQSGATLTLPPPIAEPSAPAEPPPNTGDLPPPWEVPGLEFHGRPNWLISSSVATDDAATPAPAVPPAASTPPRPRSAREERAPRAGAAPHHDEDARDHGRARRVAVALSVVASLAMAGVGAGRHFGWFERGVLARLRGATSAADADAQAAAAVDADPLMPLALGWAQSDLHQFSNGDKARVRALIERFTRAGAREVRASHIAQSGQLQIAAELVVVLPRDQAARKAVFAEYEGFLRAAFGDFVAPPKDDGGELLRVAL